MVKQLGLALILILISSCNSNDMKHSENIGPIICNDCKAGSSAADISCKLTTPELQKRKATVISSLKDQMIEKKELANGYAFKFPGTDKMLDELTEFIKTERECCDFFTFNLSISGDKREAWLELTGKEGTKDFILSELEW